MRRHDELWLRGLLASRDGKEVMRGERAAPVADAAAADALGLALADEFLARGAARLRTHDSCTRVARVERSETRGNRDRCSAHPGFAALNPGYEFRYRSAVADEERSRTSLRTRSPASASW